ncbi:MAG: GDP-mannose 4,6 dehydratase [Candidatus Pacebacteria bacterium CG10_big_fil_rev_8_21_14_0_10_56_10]|nr:MAG: GDP-mannose 4,6 dehydratase [Candidatus Pacebacteria bacterium CG10_big_fil_rev_8_21_14_0_10_56_10]
MAQPSILITGGTGFAGSHLVELLAGQGNARPDIHVTQYPGSTDSGVVSQLLPTANIHAVDLIDRSAVNQLINDLKPAQVYHLAALSRVGDSFDQADRVIIDNTQLQLNLLDAVRDHANQARLLVVGSAQEYDVQAGSRDGLTETDLLGPANPYGVSKVAQDLLSLSYHYAYQLRVVRVRPFNHIGERQASGFVVTDFSQQIVERERRASSGGQPEPIRVGNLAAVRDFTDVKDVVKAYRLVMERGHPGQVYNVGSGRGRSIQQLLDTMISLANADIAIVKDQAKFRPLDVAAIIADNSKVRSLGWQPAIPLEQTLVRVLDYWRSK